MPVRTLLTVAVVGAVAFVTLYAATVRRGPWGMRRETPLEVAGSGCAPWCTAVYAEQRVPEYPDVVRPLRPAFAVVHAVDVRVRSGYWHEQSVPQFDEPPDFERSP